MTALAGRLPLASVRADVGGLPRMSAKQICLRAFYRQREQGFKTLPLYGKGGASMGSRALGLQKLRKPGGGGIGLAQTGWRAAQAC